MWGSGITANRRGIGRDLYGTGACYAFLNGHVQSLGLANTVTSGQTLSGGLSANWEASTDTIQYNMWYPR